MTTTTTLGHIHGPAQVGVGPAPAIFNYEPPTNANSGEVVGKVFAIDPPQLAQLRAGLLYANIHSVMNPGGELRAQLVPAATYRAGTLTAAQETTPVTSNATGRAVVAVFPNNTQAAVSVGWSGLTTITWLGHIHGPAAAGATASPMLDLFDGATPPVSSSMSGSILHKIWTMTTPQRDAVIGNLTYANIHSDMYRAGEIRAQLLPPCSP
jgi:hypothetical protein